MCVDAFNMLGVIFQSASEILIERVRGKFERNKYNTGNNLLVFIFKRFNNYDNSFCKILIKTFLKFLVILRTGTICCTVVI